jgi:mannose-6-phosphate isomerase-like protein (cupin superfamily)
MEDTAVSLRVLARTGTDGSGLTCTLAVVPPGRHHVGVAGAGGELWFVMEGSGSLSVDGAPAPALVADRGLWIPAGAVCELASSAAGRLRIVVVALPGGTSWPAGANIRPAAGGAAAPFSRDLRDCPAQTTGDRKFRVLFGPGRGCPVATQFVGEIPPGRAPEHSHPYDEVVLVLRGTGVAHVAGADRELSAGRCLHLPPRQPHCLQNTGQQTMRVLGVFHPADSPAAKLPVSPAKPV